MRCLNHLAFRHTSQIATLATFGLESQPPFKIGALGSGMTKGVNQSLSTDAIDLLLNCWPQRLLLADNTGPEVHTGLGQKFLTNSGQSRREGPRTR